MKKYDVVIPLGEFCATAGALRDCDIRKASYPFDWNGAETDICGNCGFIGKIKMICNDFAGAFELQDLKETWSENKEHRGVINTKTGVHYFHDFEWGESVEKQYDSFYEKQTRRAKRLIENIETGDRILFVFVTRIKHFLSIDELKQALSLLTTRFINKDIDFLLVQDSADCEQADVSRFKINDHIYLMLYHDLPGNLGNRAVLKRIFSEFINGEVEYNFATDNIKNYGLSVKEGWGRWSNGNDVFIELPLSFNTDVVVDFNVEGYLAEQWPTQDVDVLLNDKKIATWHFDFGKEKPETVLHIPAGNIKGISLKLHFIIKNPVSPQDLNAGNDTRKLGIGFKSVKIKAI
ncbi:MAG: hypothetical protein IKA08_01385 [Alphaproteobacteria bacterium]|nr:hypothetical protein [Alphaproteobacteria bacterium]